jgi:hypothetical protein
MQNSNSSNDDESMSTKATGWFIKLFIFALAMTPVLIAHLVTGAGFWGSLLMACFAVALLAGFILTFVMFMRAGR